MIMGKYILQVERQEDYRTMTWNYYIRLFWFIKLKRILTKEQVIFEEYPLWFKLIRVVL